MTREQLKQLEADLWSAAVAKVRRAVSFLRRYAVVRQAAWKNPAELKQVYHNADLYGRRTIFNIAGNKYRLIARVNYAAQRVYVLYVLTHAQYDKGDWKA
jgi:mRNA-degrading endonuclease HigB of HigAB toxin-antitoxin module